MLHTMRLLSVLYVIGISSVTSTNPIHPTTQNVSHEIYRFPNVNHTDSANTIDCNTENCVIECMELNSCKDLTINAADINNVHILCASYNSCIDIKLNAMNQTKVNMNCFYAHSCTHSTILLFASSLELICNRADSCKNTNIWIHKPAENALDISCNTELACEDVEIETMDKTSYLSPYLNWINISTFTEDTNILFRCHEDDAYNANLLYSNEQQRMQCNRDTICCPTKYLPEDTDTSAFYSTEQTADDWMPNDYKLGDLFLFNYFSGYLAPLLCLSMLYTICVCCWATIYFCCNTLSAYNKYKAVSDSATQYFAKYPMTSVCEGTSCWNKCGYFVDGFNIVTDFLLFTSILLYSPMANNKRLWLIAGYLSVVASLFGMLFFFSKLKILTIFYPHIVLWRKELERHYKDIEYKLQQKRQLSERRKARKWSIIAHKARKISLFLQYLAMYDLFSASLQDSLQSVVILSVLMNFQMNDEHEEYNEIILDTEWNQWSIFEWILRIKLAMCFVFMFYKLLNGISVECKCHTEAIRNKQNIKPRDIIYIDTEDDTMDMDEYRHYHSVNNDTDNDSEDRNGFTPKHATTTRGKETAECETKYEEEADELKQLILPQRQWSSSATGAVTMNISHIHDYDHDTTCALMQNVEQNGAQHSAAADMVEMTPNKTEIVEMDGVYENEETKESELKKQMLNDILPNIITRKRPLSISKSAISSKSEKILQHHVMSENNTNQNNEQNTKHSDDNHDLEDEDEGSGDYDSSELSIDTEVVHD